MPRPPSDPRRGPATHRLDVVIFCGKNFPVNFIFDNERFPVNFVLTIGAGGAEIGLTIGAATGSSTSHEDGAGFDVPAGKASFSTRAPKTPGDDDAGDEEAEDEEFPLDDVAIVTALEGRASDECRTLWTQHVWMNFFFTILVVAKIEKIEVPKTIAEWGS
jgi:hypothetical protein